VTNAVQGLRALSAVDGTALARQGAGGVFATLYGLHARDRAAAGQRDERLQRDGRPRDGASGDGD
jgi:hypothetical protein